MELQTSSNKLRPVNNYLRKGGKIEYALNCVLTRSEEEHEVLGDGSFFECDEFKKELEELEGHPMDDNYDYIGKQLLPRGFSQRAL